MNSRRVLIVEDQELTATMLAQLLLSIHFTPVATAQSGEAAVQLAGRLQPDFVLMDVNLAGNMDGIAAATAIRERHNIRSVLVTGEDARDILPRARNAYPIGYLHKPFNAARLESTLHLALHLRDAQCELDQNRATLAAMLQTMPDGVMVTDLSGRILEVNHAACHLLGLTREDLLQRKVGDLVVAQCSETDAHEFGRRLAERSYFSVVMRRPENGASLELTLSNEAAAVGADRLVCFVHDATERTRAANRLRVLSRAVEQSPVVVMITDRVGHIEYVNPRFEAVTGYTSEEVIGRHPQFLASGEMPGEFYAAMWKELLAGHEWSGEFHNRRKNGEVFWEKDNISPVRDERGEISHFIALKEDVTEQKRIARNLELRQSYIAALLDNQPGPTCLKDADERLLAANAVYAEHCGHASPSHLIGLRPTECWPAEVAHAIELADQTTRECGQTALCLHDSSPGGRPRWTLIHKSLARDAAGQVIGIVSSGREITDERDAHVQLLATTHSLGRTNERLTAALTRERELLHEVEAASRAKSAFLASMSHELRTPLNVINGLSATLLRDATDERATQDARLILESGQHLLGIIQEILDYSVLEAGQAHLDIRTVDVLEVVGAAVRQVRPAARSKSLALTCSIPPATGLHLRADGRRLQQILINLLVNAVKFTERGGVHLSVRSRRIADGRTRWSFTVIDSGIGITRDGLTRIFQPFAQANEHIAPRFGGTGLGLNVSRSFAAMMGGEIVVRSVPGRGSAFRCSFLTPATPLPDDIVASLAPADWRGRRAAVDLPASRVRRELVRSLAAWGLHVTADASSPASAYDLTFVSAATPCRCPAGAGALIALQTPDANAPTTTIPGAQPLEQPLLVSELRDTLAKALARNSDAPRTASPAEPRLLAEAIPLRILGADDIRTNRAALARMLASMGYSPTLVADGGEALAALAREPFDLAIIDVQMPVLDGLSVARRVRETGGANRPRLVALTANALAEDRQRCLDAGFDEYLAKPVLPDAVEACIVRLFASGVSSSSCPAPQPATATLPPLIDRHHFTAAFRGCDAHTLACGVEQLHAAAELDLDHLLQELDGALAGRDGVAADRALHALKGCFLTIGWARAAAHAAAALDEVRTRSFTHWTTLGTSLRELSAASAGALESYLHSLRSTPAPHNAVAHH